MSTPIPHESHGTVDWANTVVISELENIQTDIIITNIIALYFISKETPIIRMISML
jgi:hypothetical protein